MVGGVDAGFGCERMEIWPEQAHSEGG